MFEGNSPQRKLDFAGALVRRFTAEQDDPWHAEALAIASDLVAALDEEPGPADFTALLSRSARLPARESGAQSVRVTLVNECLDRGYSLGERPIELGSLIIDVYGAMGVVVEPSDPPTAAWLADQKAQLVRESTNDVWWTALTFRGGAILTTERSVFVAGPPSDDQLDELLEHHTESGRDRIRAAINAATTSQSVQSRS